jgi:carboxyl-terminal processing protease
LRGVTSDIVLPSASDFSEVGESALEAPLPWDTVPTCIYDHLNRVAPYADTLRTNSERRIQADKEFRYVEDDIARLKKNLSTKSVSLNEAERRRELEQIKARRAERENDEKVLEATGPTRYEITLENVALPGLPRPLQVQGTPEKTSARAALSSVMGDVDEATKKFSPADDVTLTESERILADYVDLMARRNPPNFAER